ncbi:hypothetical protein D3C73_957620 [compost metagenome]
MLRLLVAPFVENFTQLVLFAFQAFERLERFVWLAQRLYKYRDLPFIEMRIDLSHPFFRRLRNGRKARATQ